VSRPIDRPSPATGPDSKPVKKKVPGAIVRLGVLCVFVALIGMSRPRLTPEDAGRVVLICGLVTLGAAALFALATARIASHLPVLSESRRVAAASKVLARRIGLPLLALAFFLFWTFFYLGVWWASPDVAFIGIGSNPRFADFFYYAVSTAFIAPPGDIVATSRGARTGTMIEMLTGLALVTAYAGSFFDWRRQKDPMAG
jgi:hypothetical protein